MMQAEVVAWTALAENGPPPEEAKKEKRRRPRARRGRDEGSIFQRGDGLWVAVVSLGYKENGRRRRKTVYGSTKEEVAKKLRKLQVKADAGRLRDADRMLVQEYLTAWLENTVKGKVKEATYQRYKLVVEKQINPHLGSARLQKLSPTLVEGFYADLERAGESPRTRQMAGTVLGTALRHAVHPLKLLDYNPCADVKKARTSKEEMKIWDLAQVRAFQKAAETERLYAMYVVALDAGARQGELFALRWDDLDFDAGTLKIQRSLSELRGKFAVKEPKTKAGRRTVDLCAVSLAVLNQHRQRMLAEGRNVKSGLIFCDECGGFLRKSNVTRRGFRSIMKRAKLPRIRFHDLRHTCASLLLAAGENPVVIQKRLGHERVETTLSIYSHLLPTAQKGAAAKMNAVFTPAAAASGS
jgi:integrase